MYLELAGDNQACSGLVPGLVAIGSVLQRLWRPLGGGIVGGAGSQTGSGSPYKCMRLLSILKRVMLSFCSDHRGQTTCPSLGLGSMGFDAPKYIFEVNAKAMLTQKNGGLEEVPMDGRRVWFTSLQRIFFHIPAIP